MALPPNHRLNAGELQALLDLLALEIATMADRNPPLAALYSSAREKLTIQRRLIG